MTTPPPSAGDTQPTTDAFRPDRRRGVLLALVTAVLWGTVPLAGKVALAGIGAGAMSSLRLIVAGLFIATVVSRREGGRFPLAVRPPGLAVVAALGLAANYVGYLEGLDRVGPSMAQVLIQTAPLFLIGLSIAFLGERPRPRHIAGALLAFGGVIAVVWDGGPWSRLIGDDVDGARILAGSGWILFAAATWAGYAACHKVLGRTRGSGATMAWIFVLSAVLTTPVALTETARTPDGVEIAAIVYLVANSVVAYWCFAEALRHVEASLVAVICSGGPAVTLGAMAVMNRVGWDRLPNDPLTVWKLAGAAAVVGGVVLALTAGRARAG